MNILRVYTDAANRAKVEKATSRVLGKIPSTAKISLYLAMLFLKY
jgi:hypothetical protein